MKPVIFVVEGEERMGMSIIALQIGKLFDSIKTMELIKHGKV